MNNEEYLKAFLNHLDQIALKGPAKVIYLHLIKTGKSPSPERLCARFNLEEVVVLDALAVLASKSLISGSPDKYLVHIPSFDKNAPKASVAPRNTGLSVLQIQNKYYESQAVYLKGTKKKASTDFAAFRKLCRDFGSKTIEAQIVTFFQTGIYKDYAPNGGVYGFVAYMDKLKGLSIADHF